MIIGREKEQRELMSLLDNGESQFCAVYGRRRVGKTYLIRETFNYQFCFQHTGIAKGTLRQQLTSFRNSLMAAGLKCAIPQTWIDAFELLKQLINRSDEGRLQGKNAPQEKRLFLLTSSHGWIHPRAI